MTESAENELLEPGNTELPPVPETLNMEQENAIIDDEPVQTFYKFGEDGFFLGTTGTECENCTETGFEYEPGYWYFWHPNGNPYDAAEEGYWSREKIPETAAECCNYDISGYDPENPAGNGNYVETLLAVMRRIFAEYKGEDYIFITEKDADTGLLSFRVRKEDPEIILDNHKQSRLEELHNAADSALETAGIKSSLGFKIDANEKAVRDLNGLVEIGDNDVSFCDYDNVIHDHITAEQVKTMRNEVLLNGQNLYAQKWTYRAAVNAAETLEQLNSITFKFDMLDFSE